MATPETDTDKHYSDLTEATAVFNVTDLESGIDYYVIIENDAGESEPCAGFEIRRP